VQVVVVSALDGPDIVGRARASGAAGFVCKARPACDLVETVTRILSGDNADEAAEEAAQMPRRNGHGQQDFGLTVAQKRVLDLLIKGKSNRDIAEALGLTEGTVKVHVTAILKTLRVSNRTQALLKVAKSPLPL
jgi:DNA-binding NarL/FixJ family response regulator